jgi:hypothetical protein
MCSHLKSWKWGHLLSIYTGLSRLLLCSRFWEAGSKGPSLPAVLLKTLADLRDLLRTNKHARASSWADCVSTEHRHRPVCD